MLWGIFKGFILKILSILFVLCESQVEHWKVQRCWQTS